MTSPAANGLGERARAALADRRARLVWFGAVAVGAVYLGFIAPSVDGAGKFVQRFGYYTIAATFAWFLAALWPLREAIRSVLAAPTRREWAIVGGTIVACTLVACLTVPYSYKVLYDEFVLQSTALHLHQAREVGATVRAYEVEGVFRSIGTYLDKRPPFFAFLVSLLHDLTGYREANAFALNTALFPVVLGLVYLIGRRLAGHLAGYVALVALGAFSLLAHNATGAGMELINLVMLLGVIALGIHYLAAPDGPRLAALVLAAILLTQTRYESALYVAPVALVVLEGWRRVGRPLLPWAAVFAPALLIPFALHQTYLSGSPQLWELREGEATRFGFHYLSGNLSHALNFFFSFAGSMPNSWWLALAGFPALGWAAVQLIRGARGWKRAEPAVASVAIFGAAIAANLGLLMCYYWGQLDDPIASRLSLPFSVLLAFALGWATTRFAPRWRSVAAGLAVGGAVLSYLATGLKANATHHRLNLLMAEIAWEREVVSALPAKPRLILSNKSALAWLLRETPAMPLGRARWRAPAVQFHLDHHTFSEVLVTQQLVPAGDDGVFQISARDLLPDNYVLEPIAERRFDTHRARISRVKEIRLDENTPGWQAIAQP